MSASEYRNQTVRSLVVNAERRVISQRTLVGTLRSQLAEEECKLGVAERDVAEARALAVELAVSLSGLDLGPGTLHEVFQH